MEDVVVSGAVLGRLRDLGIRTAVDDFGTGYSSLAYLLSLPLDVLKVDRSFVQVLDVSDGPAVAIVRAIAALADALGLGVLAEGVETTRSSQQLAPLGVQQGQGFLWGQAVPAEADWALGRVPAARSCRCPPAGRPTCVDAGEPAMTSRCSRRAAAHPDYLPGPDAGAQPRRLSLVSSCSARRLPRARTAAPAGARDVQRSALIVAVGFFPSPTTAPPRGTATPSSSQRPAAGALPAGPLRPLARRGRARGTAPRSRPHRCADRLDRSRRPVPAAG